MWPPLRASRAHGSRASRDRCRAGRVPDDLRGSDERERIVLPDRITLYGTVDDLTYVTGSETRFQGALGSDKPDFEPFISVALTPLSIGVLVWQRGNPVPSSDRRERRRRCPGRCPGRCPVGQRPCARGDCHFNAGGRTAKGEPGKGRGAGEKRGPRPSEAHGGAATVCARGGDDDRSGNSVR